MQPEFDQATTNPYDGPIAELSGYRVVRGEEGFLLLRRS
jgi:hypothetical protein